MEKVAHLRQNLNYHIHLLPPTKGICRIMHREQTLLKVQAQRNQRFEDEESHTADVHVADRL